MRLRTVIRRRYLGRRKTSTPSGAMQPVFTGGTDRSGTTITGKLLGAHPTLYQIPTETRFISHPRGLAALARGVVTFDEFEGLILGEWFVRGPKKGLHILMDRPTIEAALPRLRDGLARDPWAAAREFTHTLMDPLAAARGARGWVEMSPTNAKRATWLMRMFPDMRLVHSVRDGRDVACSVVRVPWGPTDPDAALDRWARKLEGAFAGCDPVPTDHVLVMQFYDLILRDREQQYARLREFVGLDDDPAMRRFFDEQMNAGGAHLGRWIEDVPPERLAAFEAHHRRLADELIGRGRPYVPLADPEPVAAPV